MKKIVLLRHGESEWNLENRFTGWTDVDLSEKGIKEAEFAGKLLLDEQYSFDLVYTSYLKRAIKTANIVLEKMDLLWIEMIKAWELNERHYGALQGLNKKETAEKYGDEQVFLWRRSYNIKPPKLDINDSRHPIYDKKYKHLDKENLPSAESLEDTILRVIPYFEKNIIPQIELGKKILICAHGNSLRALVKYLDNISDEAIVDINIPTGIPLVYELNQEYKAITHYYLKAN